MCDDFVLFDVVVFVVGNDICYLLFGIDEVVYWECVNVDVVLCFFVFVCDVGVKCVVLVGSFYLQVVLVFVDIVLYVCLCYFVDECVCVFVMLLFVVCSVNVLFVVGLVLGLCNEMFVVYMGYVKGQLVGLLVYGLVGGSNFILM